MRNALARPLIIALAFAAAFTFPLVVVLSARIPATAERQLIEPAPSDQPVPIELPRAAVQSLGGISYVHRVRLETRNIGQLADHSEVRLLVATHGTSPSLESGELAIAGTECTYRTRRGARFPNNDLLSFHRGGSCSPLRGTPTGELRLTLRFSTAGRAALWTFIPAPPAAISRDAIVVSDPALPQSPARPVVRGTLVDTYPSNSARRIELLAYVWQVASSPGWIWIAVACGGALMGCAAFCFSATGSTSEPVTDRRASVRVVAGAFCAAASLGLMYAVLVPPFQAADEPNHFVTFAALVNRPALATDSAAWAELSHFERIQFHPDEHFGPYDRERRGRPWDDGYAQDIRRGAAIAWLWRPASVLVRNLSTARVLLVLRTIDALVFASTVACCVALIAWIIGTRAPELWLLPLFLVPTLPFFATYVSNYALLVDAYLMLATGVVIASSDSARASFAGPIVAGSWMLAALVSRSALPLAPMIVAVLIARLLAGDREERVRSAAIFWGGVGVALAAGLVAADPTYLQRVTEVAGQHLPTLGATVVRAVVQHPLLAVLPAAAAAGAELLLARARRSAAARLRDGGRHIVKLIAGAAAAALLVFLAASFVVDLPRLYPVDPYKAPPAWDYARAATLAGLTMMRFGRPDYLTSVTFWGGFGWLDTLLPDPLVAALAGASGLALASLFAWIARAGGGRTLAFVCCLIGGYAVSLGVYAVSVISTTPADLHGRYLIGLYLVLLTTAWSVVPRAVEARWLDRGALLAGAAVVCTGIHVYSLLMILQRYF